MLVFFAGAPALAGERDDPEQEGQAVAWRNERPGWGFGLEFGSSGPAASLRGWANADLSFDVDAGLELRSDRPHDGSLFYPTTTTRGWVDLAPRVRLMGRPRTDFFIVPSVRVAHVVTRTADLEMGSTALRGAVGVAVDHWFTPNVSVTGRIDTAYLGVERQELDGVAGSNRVGGVQLEPTVAVHFYPGASRERASR
jgi:hypothetical protein